MEKKKATLRWQLCGQVIMQGMMIRTPPNPEKGQRRVDFG